MKSPITKVFRWLLLLAAIAAVFLFVIVPAYLEKKIEEQLEASQARVISVSVNLLTRTVTLHHLEVAIPAKHPLSLRIKKLQVRGIHVYHYLKDHELIVNQVIADGGMLLSEKNSTKENEPKNKEPKASPKLQNLFVADFRLKGLQCEARTDTIVDLSGFVDFHATQISIKVDSADSVHYTIDAFDGRLSDLNLGRNSGLYGVSVQDIKFNSKENTLSVDSLLLIPRYSKFDFAHKKGEQVSRMNLAIPKITIDSIDLRKLIDSTFIASRIVISSFDLHSFKDRRVPFLRKRVIPLPMESFPKIPFVVNVDSLIIHDSRVTVEEISEEGKESGKVMFEHINARSSWFSNRYETGQPVNTILKATGLLMNVGEIDATFTLPLDGSPVYKAKGSIKDMPFVALNPALEDLVRFRVESGRLNNMSFQFDYTDLMSDGTLVIDYESLQVTGLNKKNDNTSEIKTLLVNALVKNSKSQETPKYKRTGKIYIERDRKRYIFNFWWKSILNGFQSSVLGTNRNMVKTNSKK